MRFLLITSIDMERSLTQRPHYLADYLQNKGLLHVLSTKYGQKVGHREIKYNGKYINMAIECRFMDLFNENFLYDRIPPGGFYDAVICEGPWAGLLGIKLKEHGRTGLFVYEDIDYFPAFYEYDFIYEKIRSMEDRCMSKADLIFTVSKTLKKLRDSYIDSNKIFVSPNGVEEINTPQKNVYKNIVYAGTLDDWSGMDLVLKAYSRVAEIERESKLFIYGSGKKANEYKKMIRELNISERAFIMGKIPHRQLLDVYSRSFVGVCMLKPVEVVRYCFPIKLTEYMAAGLPVIATKCGDMADIVSESGCGISVEYGENEIKNALLHLISMSKEERHMMQENGMSYAGKFKWEDILKSELKIIQARL